MAGLGARGKLLSSPALTVCDNIQMDALIDQALETLLHSAIWRSTWYMSLSTLIIVAVIAFLILAYRRTRKGRGRFSRRGTGKGGYRYRSRYRK